MIVGCVKEIKNSENRVGLNLESVREYVRHQHTVLIQAHAGDNSGIKDEDYRAAGAQIIATAEEVWTKSQMIVKVKEPLPEEYRHFRSGLIVYTYLHLAANLNLTMEMLNSGVTGIAYETIQTKDGQLPCLRPMSQVAGRLAAIAAAEYLLKYHDGQGLLISGVPGTRRAKAVILGAGVVGQNALQLLVGLQADCTVLDISLDKLSYLDGLYGGKIKTLFASQKNIYDSLLTADVVIGAVLVSGAPTAKLIRREYYPKMKSGCLLIDVSIDQGGCSEVSRPTTYEKPTYVVDDIVHYCVANMPGGVPLTSTSALNNATIRYGLPLAGQGLAALADPELRHGLNVHEGRCYHPGVTAAFPHIGLSDIEELIPRHS
jgi:alanine dehydrogenase